MPTGKQQAVNLAKKIARQVAQEPLEVLKTAGDQISGAPERQEVKTEQSQNNPPAENQTADRGQKVKQKDTSLLKALESEIKDIQKQDLITSLQAKIANGETVYLDQYSQLTDSQRQMLEGQIETVKYQKEQQKFASQNAIPQATSKPGRKMGSTQKQAAQKEQQRVEKPVPPSG